MSSAGAAYTGGAVVVHHQPVTIAAVWRLIAVNALTAVLFGGLYGLAGARLIPQALFSASLVVLLATMLVLWLHAESVHAALTPVARVGRASFALIVVLLAGPTAVLLPLFGLESIVPTEAHDALQRGPIMALVLIAVLWTVVVNAAGAVVIGGRGLIRRARRRRVGVT